MFGPVERDGIVYTKFVEQLTADELMVHIRKLKTKEFVYYGNTFRSYNSLNRFGKHHRLNHGKAFTHPGKKYINRIEEFWSTRSILYTAGFPNIIFRCTLKMLNIDLITEKKICLNCFYIFILVTFPTNYLNFK